MTTYHIDLKYAWEPQIRKHLVHPGRLKVLPSRSALNDGKCYVLHLGLEDRVVFKTFHKRNFSGRLALPGGEPFEKWTFTSEYDSLYIGYTESWGHSSGGAAHTPTNVPGAGALIALLNRGHKQASMHAVTLSPNIERHSEGAQITGRGAEKPMHDTLFTRRFEDRHAYRGGSISNGALSNILATWYHRRKGGAGGVGTFASTVTGAAEVAKELVRA